MQSKAKKTNSRKWIWSCLTDRDSYQSTSMIQKTNEAMHYILKKYRNYRILYLLAYLAFRVTMKWYCTAVSRSCLSFNRRFWEHASSRKVRYFLEVVVHRLGIFWRFSVFFKRTSNLKVNRPNMTGATAQEIETQVKDSYKNISTQYTQINIRATCEQFSVWCQIHQKFYDECHT